MSAPAPDDHGPGPGGPARRGGGILAHLRDQGREAAAAFRALPREPVVILLTIPVVMTVMWYFGRSNSFREHFQRYVPEGAPLAHLYPFFYFVGSNVLLRLVIPLLLIRFLLRRPLRDYGFRAPARWDLAWVYAALFLAVLPFIVHASSLPSFQAKYPLMGDAGVVDGRIAVWDFVAYQLVYGLLFVAGESFWRGFVVFGLQRHIGDLAILVMVIPYCMSHFGKPAPETLGAILTGTVLGFLALRHRSFWLGVGAHWAAALTMDLLAIWRRGIPFS